MLILLSQDQLPLALNAIKARKPGSKSCFIEGSLLGQIEGRVGLEFWVDQWPHFTNIFVITNSSYLEMVIQLRKEQLSEALNHLKTFKIAADTYKMTGQLHSEIHHPFGQKFYVDKWPNFDTIVSYADQNTIIKHLPSFSFTTQTDDIETLKLILKEVVNPPEKGELYCEGVPSTFIDALEDLAEEWDKEYVCYISCYVLTTDMDHLKQHKLADGYTADSATLEDAELIAASWPFTTGEPTHLITRYDVASRPSVAIRTRDGKLTGWEVMHYWFCPGMLHVLPEHQGKGLAKYIVSALAKKMLDEENFLYNHAEKDNAISLNLHKKCGFSIIEGTDAHWGKFVRKQRINGTCEQ